MITKQLLIQQGMTRTGYTKFIVMYLAVIYRMINYYITKRVKRTIYSYIKAKTKNIFFALSDANDTREIRYVNSETPGAEFKVLIPRKEGVKYYAEHFEDKFSIRSNEVGNNYEVFTLPVSDPVIANKKVLIPHRDNVLIQNVEYLKGYAVIKLREDGLARIQILDMSNGETYYINFDEPSYTAFGNLNKEYNSETYRYSYLSLTTPETIFDYDLKNRTSKIVKMQEISGGYNKEDYKTERIFAKSYDGTQIPFHWFIRKDWCAMEIPLR